MIRWSGGGTAADLAATNPIPASLRVLVEEDTLRFKVGDGQRPWLELPYAGRIAANGQSWVWMPPAAQQWLPVLWATRPGDTAQTTFDPALTVNSGDLEVTWQPRPWTAAELLDNTRTLNLGTLDEAARQASATDTAYLRLASPTQAQALAQVEALTRQARTLIRLVRWLLGHRDALDGEDIS